MNEEFRQMLSINSHLAGQPSKTEGPRLSSPVETAVVQTSMAVSGPVRSHRKELPMISRNPAIRRLAVLPSVALLLGAALALSACQQQVAHAPEPVRPVKVVKVEANAATRQII